MEISKIMRFGIIVIFPVLLLSPGLSAQTPRTLLWKISGNGINTSYLYGTMHSGDKRVYYLGDSVYSSISSCQGFAMEIDPVDYLDTMTNALETDELDVGYRNAIANDIGKRDPDFYKRARYALDSMLYVLRQRFENMSDRDYARLEKLYNRRRKNNMRTKLDLFLFDIAKRQGKVVGGVEDIGEHMSISDELGNSIDPEVFVKSQTKKKYPDVEEWMIKTYNEADLDKLEEFSKNTQTPRQLTIVLFKRNEIMTKSIDSLGRIRSTFSAVGAAHLPGDSGVISLLRKKGYTVTPVFSSRKVEPGDIAIGNKLTMTSFSDADSNYTVQLPGRPTDLTWITNKIVLKTYKEFANEIMLMHGVYEDGDAKKTLGNQLDEIRKFFTAQEVKLYNAEKINRQGIDGYEMRFKHPEGYMNMHFYLIKSKILLFAAGSKEKDSLDAYRCRDFLSTYILYPDRVRSESAMLTYNSPDKAFSVNLPTLPKKENIQGDKTTTSEDVTLYNSFDTRRKISYLVMLKEPFRGFFTGLDSSVFVQTLEQIKSGIRTSAIGQEEILLDGIPALKVKIKGEAEGKSQIVFSVLAIRDNRLYNLTARGLAVIENETAFDKFINSFHFTPYLESKFSDQHDLNGLFTVKAPSLIYTMTAKVKMADGRKDYYAYDSNRAVSYGITTTPFSKYYWTRDEATLLDEQVAVYFNDSLAVRNVYNGDSLVSKTTTTNGGITARELILKNTATGVYTRIRLMYNGDSLWVLNTMGAKAMVTDQGANAFFSSFRLLNKNGKSSVFESKSAKLLKDLQSADANISREALTTLRNGFRFTSADLNLLLDALQASYTVTPDKSVVPLLLAKAIIPLTNDEVVAYIQTHYSLLKGKNEEARLEMTSILAGSGKATAYKVLKNILVKDPPATQTADVLLSNLSRYPALSATLFPELSAKITDENTGPAILHLANALIDSGKLQYSSFKEQEDDVLKWGKKAHRLYSENSNTFSFPYINGLLEMMARSDKKQARSVLTDFIELNIPALTSAVIVAMAKNKNPVSTDIMDAYCKDPQLRINLYDAFEKAGAISFFRGTYGNQRSFAEAFAMLGAEREIVGDVPKYYDLLETRDAVANGIMSRFYIFKITCQFKRSTEIFTGMIGPFTTGGTYLSIPEGKDVFMLYRKKFEPTELNKAFENYVQQVTIANK